MIIGLILGCILCYFVLRPKIKVSNSVNENIAKENNLLSEKCNQLKEKETVLRDKVNKLEIMEASLLARKTEILAYINEIQQQADKSTQTIYDKSYDLMQEKLSQAAEQLSKDYQLLEEKCKNDYILTLRDCGAELAATLASKLEEIRLTQLELDTLRAKATAAITAAKREEEKQLELDKYKILVTNLDLLEINRLREIAPYFRSPRAIYKIIWESYYRNNTTEMINRVVGTGIHTGIYKLTNLLNQKVYIGQAADLGSRLKDHVKAGLGIDTPNNKLYAAMLKDGVENFSFEVIEECARAELNDRETYWIDFYASQDFGYNMTRGGARQ